MTPGRECPGKENYQHILSGLEFQSGPQISTGVWWAAVYWGFLRALFWQHCWFESRWVYGTGCCVRVSGDIGSDKKVPNYDLSAAERQKKQQGFPLISLEFRLVSNRGVKMRFTLVSFRSDWCGFVVLQRRNTFAAGPPGHKGVKYDLISKVVFDNPSLETLVWRSKKRLQHKQRLSAEEEEKKTSMKWQTEPYSQDWLRYRVSSLFFSWRFHLWIQSCSDP